MEGHQLKSGAAGSSTVLKCFTVAWNALPDQINNCTGMASRCSPNCKFRKKKKRTEQKKRNRNWEVCRTESKARRLY